MPQIGWFEILIIVAVSIIVIGPKSRAHVFNQKGRHITSMRLGVGEIERKQGQKRWQMVSPNRIRAFKATLPDSDENM